MAYTTIDKSSDYFNTLLYTGNGSARSITGVGFQPDWVWVKSRTTTHQPVLSDSVRGTGKELRSDTTDAESSLGDITSFDSDGFSIGTRGEINNNTTPFVSWNWKASGSTASNTDGSITSTVSANTTAGFSIVSFTGTGANATVGHGLGSAPRMMIFKNRDEGAEGWFVYHESIGNTKRLLLDETSATSTSSTFWQDTSPTSSVFSVGSNHGCNGPDAMICYAFAEKKGYSKFGSYVANGNSDNAFAHTGFKVAFLMTKLSSTSGGSWEIVDNKRDGFNGENHRLYPSDESAEGTGNDYDLLSNGFKVRQSGGSQQSGRTNIYMAFAESPFVSSGGIPCTAR